MSNLSDLIAAIAKQALNAQNNPQNQNQQQNNTQQNPSSGLGSILGSVLSSLSNTNQQQNGQQYNQQQNNNQGFNGSSFNGLIGTLLASMIGKKVGGVKGAILAAVIPMILNWIQQQGGLEQALNKLRGKGMSDKVNQWVDPNQSNVPATMQDVEQLFDEKDVQQVADETHTTKQEVYSTISDTLPQVIDALTPQGHQTNLNESNQNIQNMLNQNQPKG